MSLGNALKLMIAAVIVVLGNALVLAQPQALHKPAATADFNLDGQVEFSDFLLFAGVYGQPGTGNNGKFDLDNSGMIDFADFLKFAAAYRQQARSTYVDSYELKDNAYGTLVSVIVDDASRTIVTNSLPNHTTGVFPNDGNPNSISAQSLRYEFPIAPTFTGNSTSAREPGVAVNGVPYEPGTAESVSCGTGEFFRIEALQEVYNLGFDVNNAHVQPTGKYHYHGVPKLLVEAYASDDDLKHVGFAADGYLIYYSRSGAYQPSYLLSKTLRTGENCVASGPNPRIFNLAGTLPDGTYTSDWQYKEEIGDLDQCNGTSIDGQYVYIITDGYPYIPRCLNGEFTHISKGSPPPPRGPRPRGRP
jgi:hypothetical protein